MAAGDRHGGAAGVTGLSADGLKQQWPAGDRFAMMIGSARRTNRFHQFEDQRDVAAIKRSA